MGYAILNKPGGLPGHGCRSNNTENVCVLYHEALKVKLLRINMYRLFLFGKDEGENYQNNSTHPVIDALIIL